MKIKAFLFDLDNTLYNYDAAHECAMAALLDAYGGAFGLSAPDFQTLYAETMAEQIRRAGGGCAGIHSRLIRFQMMLERLGQPVSRAPDMDQTYWTAFLNSMRPDPETGRILDTLRAAGYRVGVGTNMTAEWQYAKLRKLDLLDRIDFLVSSEEANAEKPDRRLFDLCAEKAGCPAEACAFVGDSWKHDVIGAQNAGMLPIWLTAPYPIRDMPTYPVQDAPPDTAQDTPPDMPRTVLRIDSLAELLRDPFCTLCISRASH